MNVQSSQDAYNDIINYMNSHGYAANYWYVGIASDWEQRLFSDHNVDRNKGVWIARQCAGDVYSRAVEQSLLKLGCSGGQGGGENTTVFVYAYLMTLATKQ